MGKTNKIIRELADVCGPYLSDKHYLGLRYYLTFHKRINWKHPVTYNEKIQWMKVYDHNPLYSTLVDKYEVRKYISEKIGDEYLIPCLGVWDKFDDIDFSKLPEQFVLKCTHDSGSVTICRDKSSFDVEKAKKHFEACMKRNSYLGGREWAYKAVKPRIIAEKFMVDDSMVGLKDYKFFCFDGKVKMMFIATDRGVEGQDVKFDFYDENFTHLPFKHGHEHAKTEPQKPIGFDEMKVLAEKLSKGMRQVRIDLYDINGKIYFGEFTFYHHCGFVPFDPEEWDEKIGSWIKI